MPDREKVIKGLAEISEYARAKADIAGIGKGKEVFDGWYRAAEDALALLKEQEPVTPRWTHPTVDKNVMMCGGCGIEIPLGKPNYCPWCGMRVKWDET